MTIEFRCLLDDQDRWRWQLHDVDSDRVLASSWSSFPNREDCLDGIEFFRRHAPKAPIVDATDTHTE